jgi:diguanylate cyclase (GGDEF)-like protein/PAS domain S-box-containing protein
MPRLKSIHPTEYVVVYVVCLAALTIGLMITRVPSQLMMVMLVPILLAVVVYPKRLYLITVPLFIFAYVGLLLYNRELDVNAMGMVTGSLVTFVIAEATYRLLTERSKLQTELRAGEEINRAIIEKSPLGISVRARNGCLLSYNEAWKKIWAMPDEAIQEDLRRERKRLTFDQHDDYLGEAMSEVEQVYSQGGQTFLPELKTKGARPGSARWVSQYFYAIQDPGGVVNRVVIITEDISKRKQMEQCEKENRILAEALRDTAAALNSTLKLEEVLERILINVGRVVPHDAVNIMLLKDGIASINRIQGYTELGLEEALKSMRLPLKDMPFLRRMAENGAPVFVVDTSAEPEWVAIPETAWIRSYAGAPVRIKGEPVGFINLDSAQVGFYTAAHVERLRAFADQAAIAIENARLYEEVQRLAIMDELTGVYNYRGLFELGQREVERSHRYHHSLTALFFDIDHFRIFNKQYTHSVGNQVLRAVAECSKVRVRAVDLVARYGGEEFAIILTQTDAPTAVQVADRLRQDIENMRISTPYGNLSVTVSIGVAELCDEVQDLSMLLDRADQAEHEAKEHGRNRVEFWVNSK